MNAKKETHTVNVYFKDMPMHLHFSMSLDTTLKTVFDVLQQKFNAIRGTVASKSGNYAACYFDDSAAFYTVTTEKKLDRGTTFGDLKSNNIVGLTFARVKGSSKAVTLCSKRVDEKKMTPDQLRKRKRECHEIVEKSFNGVVGMSSVKEQIDSWLRSYLVNKRRRDAGRGRNDSQRFHMMFKGNPGTGKTTVARVMGNILKTLGIVSKGHLVEVQRGDLIGQYVGSGETKTANEIEKAQGGVLFVDEAYRLTNVHSSNDYGKQALDVIMRHLDDKDLVVIFAGYPVEMEAFISANPGLRRRVPHTFLFKDYTPDEIAAILKAKVRKDGIKLHPEITSDWLTRRISLSFPRVTMAQYNGSIAESVYARADEALCARVDCIDDHIDKLDSITRADINVALRKLRNEWGISESERRILQSIKTN